jgi:hypothetical protein
MPEEERIVDPNTGGAKGQKLARFDLIPPDPMWQLAEVYGLGAKKYEDDNWLKGYRWRLSIGALLRHVFMFTRGEYLDAESERPHLAHAMFHCCALMEFHRLHRGTDDRQCTTIGAQGYKALLQSLEEMAKAPCEPVDKRKRVYVAGPMRGIRFYNFGAFDAASAWLRVQGHDVVNPADLDRDTGFDPYTLPNSHDWSTTPPGFDMKACRRRDLDALETCDAIYMLNGWWNSRGARAEKAHAEWIGLEVMQ